MEELGCLFIVVVILILLIVLSFHLFIWLIVIIALAGFLERLKRYYEKNNEAAKIKTPASRFASSLVISFLDGLTETGVCIAGGLAIVILCNAGFWMFRDYRSFESPDTLLAAENGLIKICEHLKSDFKPHLAPLIVILVAMLVIDKLIPKLGVMNRWKLIQTFIKRATIVLMTISAFTFFTVEEVARQEPKWVSQMIPTVQFSLDFIGKERKRIVAEAIIEARIEHLPETSKTQLNQFFHVAVPRKDGKDVAAVVAKRLAKSDSKISNLSELMSPPTPNSVDDTIARASRWLNAGGTPIRIADVRVLRDEETKEIHEEVEGEMQLTRTFFKEVLVGTLEATVPDNMSEAVERFLEIIIDSVSEAISGTVIPDAGNLASAKKRIKNREVAEILTTEQGDDQVWNVESLSHGRLTVDVLVVRLGDYLQANPSRIPKTTSEIEDENRAKSFAEAKKWVEKYRESKGETGDHPVEGIP